MSWKINKITFENFKVFKEPCNFSIGGKHLLLFGENGSGKSSLNWGLYTFLQSVLKMPDAAEAQKYFTAAHGQNLRNRFSDDADYSGIKIEFIDDNGRTLTLEDSRDTVNTHLGGALSIRFSLGASDFLNYKYLISIFDFKNSAPNDIFSILYSEVFPIDDLANPVSDINGVALGKNIKLWWDTLNETLAALPRGNGKNINHILRNGPKWKSFVNTLDDFNDQLRLFLDGVEMRANNILKTKFKVPVEIKFTYNKADWTKVKATPATGNLKLKHPKILLNAEYLHPAVVNGHVNHPRSFFNEATLSKMALALRLAITSNRVANGPDVCKILVIDDLLLSLDMANRMDVIDLLLEHAKDFQMFILTHDRGFHQTIQNKILQRKQQSQWLVSQIYLKPSLSRRDIPQPIVCNSKPGLDQAMDFYLRGEFEAAVVTLRKECELNLKRIVPFIDIIDIDKAHKKGQVKYNDLSKMIDALTSYYGRHYTPDMSTLMPNLTPNLDTYRQLLLNQAAHNDYETPRFSAEIEAAFGEIKTLSEISKYILIPNTKINTDDYIFELTDAAGNPQTFTFKFADILSVLNCNGNDYYCDTTILIGSALADFHDKIHDFCNTHHTPVPADILLHTKHKATSLPLSDTLLRLKS